MKTDTLKKLAYAIASFISLIFTIIYAVIFYTQNPMSLYPIYLTINIDFILAVCLIGEAIIAIKQDNYTIVPKYTLEIEEEENE